MPQDTLELRLAPEDVPLLLNDPAFRATRVNLFGNLDATDFTMKDAVKVTSGGHPFASVNIKGQNFYIFGGKLDDTLMRRALTNEQY